MKQAEVHKTADPQQKEALISLTTLYFIEEHSLLPREKLEDAKRSLQALFLRASGEETMLRKLIEVLKTTKQIHQSFSSILTILAGISKSVLTISSKLAALRQYLERFKVTAEENKDFIGPFLSFSQIFLQKTERFAADMREYLGLKEKEARCHGVYRIARDARERLRQRLSSGLGAETRGEIESKIREEIMASFDYGDAEQNLKYAARDSEQKEAEIQDQLEGIKAMCQMAMNPEMREKTDDGRGYRGEEYDDVFVLFSAALRRHSRLVQLKDAVIALFKLYQHSYGIFSLDFNNLDKAIATMFDNSDAYFEAKEEDRDIKTKRDKLKKIEALIPFLEDTARLLREPEFDTYYKFSRKLSDLIGKERSQWAHISEDLLRSKVQAEAELSTRL